MLSRRRRLRTTEVAEVLRIGKNFRGRFLSAKVLGGSDDTIRVAAVVPKSLIKGAVSRNRVRRALYRAIASLPEEKRGNKAALIVFFVRAVPPPPLAPTFAGDVKKILSSLL